MAEHRSESADDPARRRVWVVDTGSMRHSTNDSSCLFNIKQKKHTLGTFAKGATGVMEGMVDTDGMGFVAKDVLYLPNSEKNMLSVQSLAKDNHVVVFDNGGCNIYSGDECKVEGNVKARARVANDGLYKLVTADEDQDRVTGSKKSKILWHRRLGHMDIANILILHDFMATGVDLDLRSRKIECVVPYCKNYFQEVHTPIVLSRFNINGYPRASRLLETVFFFITTSEIKESLSGNRYFVIFVDDYSRKTFVYFLKKEIDIVPTLIYFKNYAELYTGMKIFNMISDYDLYIRSVRTPVENFMASNNIQFLYLNICNGLIEYIRYIIYIKKICYLIDANMSCRYWAEAVDAIVSLLNMSPHMGLQYMTPEEAWSGMKPDLSAIRVFGCKAYVPYLKKHLIHVRYDFETGNYRLIDSGHYGVYYENTVIFDEDVPYFNE